MLFIGKKIFSLLNPAERLQALGILILTIMMAFLEMAGIASILPFIAVLSAPEKIHENKWGQQLFDFLGFESDRQFLLFLGLVVLIFLVISNTMKAVTRWATLKFSQMRGHGFASILFRQYLYQPYAFFLKHSSSELRKNLAGEVQALVTNIMLPFMDLIARIIVTISIIGLLILVDPVLAVSTALVLGSIYMIIYWPMRGWLYRLGQDRIKAQGEKSKILSESLLGIKNVKLTGHEETYLKLFDIPSRTVSRTSALNSIASELPRYALEIVAFGGILFIVLYKLLESQNFSNILPIISLYALAGYRLLPNFQSAFTAITKMRFNHAILEHISEELVSTAQSQVLSDNEISLNFSSSIELRNIGFKYESADKPVFENINLTIPANTSLGIIGKTGSGKTTLVDIILGLLSPTEGEVFVDGIKITDENRRAWQKNTAYVTQHIFLIDNTIRRNIAFGVSDEMIDDAKLYQAAKMAALDEFVTSLPEGYNTVIGENGVRLSGGQRQRIGLARALYLDRPILVLDEATSALDQETEQEVMQAVNNIGSQKTIIMITHRLNSLSAADTIFDMKKTS